MVCLFKDISLAINLKCHLIDFHSDLSHNKYKTLEFHFSPIPGTFVDIIKSV